MQSVIITNHFRAKFSLNHNQGQTKRLAKYYSVYLTNTPVPTTLELRPCSRCHLTSGKELSINWLLLNLRNNRTLLNGTISFIKTAMGFGLLFLCGYVKTGCDENGRLSRSRETWLGRKVFKVLLSYQLQSHFIRLSIITIF